MNKLIVFLMTLILMVPITGCWDVRDITNRAFVTAVGLDASDQGYRVTVSIPSPAGIRNRSARDYSLTETVEAESISKAVSLLQSKLSRDINFGHLRLLLIGEKLAAEKNFNDLMSFFGKNSELALRFRLMFVDGGEAEEVMKTLPFLERSSTAELIGLIEAGINLGIVRTKRYYDFLGDLRLTDGRAMGARIILDKSDGRPNLSRIGGAIFANWRLAGWLTPEEMQEANWLLRQNPRIMVVARLEGGQFSCEIEKKSVMLTPEIKNGKLKFRARIKAVGNVCEQQQTSLDLTEPGNLKKLEEAVKKEISKQAYKAVEKSQKEVGIDYLGFDRALIKNEPEVYKKLNWPEIYPDIPVEIELDFRIPTVGIERR